MLYQLSYEPGRVCRLDPRRWIRQHETVLQSAELNRDRIVPGRPAGQSVVLRPTTLLSGVVKDLGGDPSAGSPTDTLLRLNPACRIEVQARQEACLHYDPTRMV